MPDYDPAKSLLIDPVMVYSTYLNTGDVDGSNGMAVDQAGNSYIVGSTKGIRAPFGTLSNYGSGHSAAFLIKIDQSGNWVYSTALGGGFGFDSAHGVAVDSAGNTYITGSAGAGFPMVNALQPVYGGGGDVFVAKLQTSTGTLMYSTYLGGSGEDFGEGIAVDSSGSVYVTGSAAAGFPVLNPVQQTFGGALADAFVAKINAQGSALVYSTYLGGSGNDYAFAIVVDSTGSAYVTGSTTGPFPVTSNAFQLTWAGESDAFIAKLNPQGNALVYSTYLGGPTADGGRAIAVDLSGQAYVTGFTEGGFPVANALQPTFGGGIDVFVAKINTAGTALIYSTYLGGAGNDGGAGIALDSNGDVFVTGFTDGHFPLVNAFQPDFGGIIDAFVAMINPQGNALVYSSYLGGAGQDGGQAIGLDAGGNLYVAGSTTSPDFPTFRGIEDRGPGLDSFLAVISNSTLSTAFLEVRCRHTGDFFARQPGTYTITVRNNSGATPTAGSVQVQDFLPPSLTLLAMTGVGWNCTNSQCSRSDVLPAGAAYPVITVTVVGAQGTPPLANRVVVSGGGSPSDTAIDTTTVKPPALSISAKVLNFGVSGSIITSPQTIELDFAPEVAVPWSASPDHAPNIVVSPSSGIGQGSFQVSVTGGPSATIIFGSEASNSPQFIIVSITNVTPAAPFGSFDTPLEGAVQIAGAIPVTGWALDNIEVTRVDIFREPVTGEPAGNLIFIGTAVFSAGARPDVATQFPGLPYQYRAGWGYQMLTNSLPNSDGSPGSGNGTYKLHAIAFNKAGLQAELGTKTITVDNAHLNKPFGTIDTRSQGGTASGTDYVNFGWALTPQPGGIPLDGSTITVVIDGVVVGHPTYNQFRSDIASLFPNYKNTMGAVGYFHINTSTLTNGIHTISWNVFDDLGRGQGLGSRYFKVLNTGTGAGVAAPDDVIEPIAVEGVQVRHGLNINRAPEPMVPDSDGAYSVTMEEVGLIELHLGAIGGNLMVEGQARALPVGSTLKDGIFYWQPGPGFLGEYPMHFQRPDGSMIPVRVNIIPKRY